MGRRLAILFFVLLFYFNLYSLKCLWVTRWDIKSKRSIDNIVKFAKNNGIDILFVQVFGNGRSFWSTRNYPMGVESFDPLRYIVKKSHDKGIEVDAWINMGYIWSYSTPPPSLHIWNVLKDNRVEYKGNSVDYDFMRSKNAEGLYVSLSTERVRNYYINMIKEILSNYNVDGIHLDYIRYPGKSFIYGKAERSEFYREYYIDIYSSGDKKLFNEYYNNILNKYVDFQREGVTKLVKSIKKLTDYYGKRLTCAVIADYKRAKNQLMQDWVLWVNNDYIDYAVPMAYTSNTKVFKRLVNDYLRLVDDDEKLIIGVGAYNQSSYSLSKKLNYLVSKGIDRVSFFSYKGIMDRGKNYLKETGYLWAF